MAVEHLGPRSLRQLLDAVLAIGGELDLEVALRRIVEAGVSLVDARYGALGVLDETHSGLVEFITVGLDDDTHRAIGDLPKGLGVLGSLIADARPLRVPIVGEHPDSAGFPAHHPRMSSFLGVPIVVRGEVFGNLYLTDKTTADAFSDLDEQLATGLASAAGVVIDNARLFGTASRREAALTAVHDVMAAYAEGSSGRSTLHMLAERARVLVGADLATIARPMHDQVNLVIDVVAGDVATDLAGHVFPIAGSISGEVIKLGTSIVLTDASKDHRGRQPQVSGGQIGPSVWVALSASGERMGTLSVARLTGSRPFTEAELELVRLFATQASVIIELDQSRDYILRLSMLEDQERIARDLHDTVIQRLFATGLSLQSASRIERDPLVAQRIASAVDDLDDTVRHIRTVIFGLDRPHTVMNTKLRAQAVELCAEAARVLGFEPQLLFAGPLDTTVSAPLADELLAVLREALSNVSRHAHAHHVDVDIAIRGGQLILTVTDDGVGLTGHSDHAGQGQRNMEARAADVGGTFDLSSVPTGGARVSWSAPMTGAPPDP